MLQCLFNNVTGLKISSFVKVRFQSRIFLVNIGEFLKASLFTEHLWWLLLKFSEYLFKRNIIIFNKKGKTISEFFRTCYILKVMDNLHGYGSSDDILLGGEEHNNVIENENGRTVIKVTLHIK